METFKVVLCGGSGLLGQELLHNIPEGIEVWAPSSTEVDLRSKAQVLEQLRSYKPSLIINAAAYTNVDAAETNADVAYAVNRDGPENLGLYAAEAAIPVIHVSTDYVFDGTKCTPYIETDVPNPINVYGKSKLAGEQALQKVCEQSLILRTSWLFGEYGNSFIRRFMVMMSTKKSIDVVADQYSALTRADGFSAYIWFIARRVKLGLPITWGVTHFSDGELCSKYDLINRVFNVLIKNKESLECEKITPVTHDFFINSAKRPKSILLKKNDNNLNFYEFESTDNLDKYIMRVYRKKDSIR